MKRILFLGGIHQQIPPTEYARGAGYYTALCDSNPNSPAKHHVDEFVNISTTDKDAVLACAKRIGIDGIVAYASDPAALTAAYVAEKMRLVGNPVKSVEILTRKDLFRAWQLENGFNAPRTLEWVEFPCVIKPVDSSGSKGVSIVRCQDEVDNAIAEAKRYSRCGKIIIEEFIQRDSYQIAGDGFIVDGKLVSAVFANEHFHGVVPIGESFPYVGNADPRSEIQRLIDLLGIKQGALNFDIVVSGGKIYLMEIGPRNGGCLIPEVIKYATGVDMIAATVDSALGNKVRLSEPEFRGYYSSYMIHSTKAGKFVSLEIDDVEVIEQHLWVNVGDEVKEYKGSDCTLGTMILRFGSQLEMLEKMNRMNEIVRVVVE